MEERHHLRGERERSAGKVLVGVIGVLVGFAIVVYLVSSHYLLPAMSISKDLDAPGKKQLAAISSLVLAVVLTSLVAIIFLVLRPGKLLFSRKTPPRTQTKYVDVWAEAGKRMETPKSEEDQD